MSGRQCSQDTRWMILWRRTYEAWGLHGLDDDQMNVSNDDHTLDN